MISLIFYAIRHGQTDWNVNQILQGRTDVELNETGINQAKEAAKQMKGVKVDLIVCSTLKRARHTADILNEVLGAKIIYNDALRERGFGEFEGGDIKKLWQEDIFKSGILYNYEKDIHYKDVEPVRELCARVWGLIDKLKAEYPDKTIMLVTHGGTMNAINAYFCGVGVDGQILRSPVAGNCELKRYEI